MSATVTITGKAGPDVTVTAQVFTGCTFVNFDCVTNIVSFAGADGQVKTISINAAATITVTKAANTATYTFAIS